MHSGNEIQVALVHIDPTRLAYAIFQLKWNRQLQVNYIMVPFAQNKKDIVKNKVCIEKGKREIRKKYSFEVCVSKSMRLARVNRSG